MKRTILLAGPSAAGKSTLAKALAHGGQRFVVSTSAHLRGLTGLKSSSDLFVAGAKLDRDNPNWLYGLVHHDLRNSVAVVDAVRSFEQHNAFGTDAVRVNVVVDEEDVNPRHAARGTQPVNTPFMFNRPDFVWNSSRVALSTAVQAINQMSGGGYVDVLIGGQFGSEGKGKLAAILAPNFDVLLRSGGPNAGHWVRTEDYEFCFHHLPSGTLANRSADIFIAAGATLYPPKFWEEVGATGCKGRLHVDRNAILISDEDRERESKLVGMVGSTAQGVGSAQARRILRGLDGSVQTAWDDQEFFRPFTSDLSARLTHEVSAGKRVLAEGTQGAMLSLYHGEYPFTTSRDTNTSGLLSEAGIAPSLVRNTWMVVRSHPIRVGGNSGPMEDELQWSDVARRAGRDTGQLMGQELTSTTKRQRRVGEFSWSQFKSVVDLNRPTRIFLSFADYIHPKAAGMRKWESLPDEVLKFVEKLEQESGAPVAGVSTGRSQGDVAMRWGFV